MSSSLSYLSFEGVSRDSSLSRSFSDGVSLYSSLVLSNVIDNGIVDVLAFVYGPLNLHSSICAARLFPLPMILIAVVCSLALHSLP